MSKSIAMLLLFVVALAVSGCSGTVESVIDPDGYTARTQAQEKSRQEEASAESQRWLAEGQQADADKARADAEARAAEAAAAAAQAQAEAQARTAEANADAFAAAVEAVRQAAQPNNAPIIVAMILMVAIAGWAIWNARKTTVDTIAATRQLQTPHSVLLAAQQHHLIPHHDGQRWLLCDEHGNVIKQQRLITG